MQQDYFALRREIDQAFDGQAFVRPLFYSYPDGLRFGLSEGAGETPLNQVLLALRKATPICEDIFAAEAVITVCLRKYANPNSFSYRATLRELRAAGILIPAERCVWVEPFKLDDRFAQDVEEWWLNIAFEAPIAALQSLLWCAFTVDFPSIRPNPRCAIYLFNIKQQIIAFPYDDRGMDVVGQDRALLAELYGKYTANLGEYDRAMMDQTFA
jgi:hypothetical protein